MKKQEKRIWITAGAFFLLGAVLCVVPGVRFSGYLCFCLAALVLVWLALVRWSGKSTVGKWCKRIFLVGCAAVFVVLACFEAVILRYGEEDHSALPVDAVIVLGAGVNGTKPSFTLRTRLDTTLAYLEEHPHIPVVVTGGRGFGEDITEAACMYEYLTARGAAPEQIILEDRSTSTAENFAFAKPLLEAAGVDTEESRIAVVTNDFHSFRAKLIAQREGLQTVGVGAELPWWWLNANYYIRESFALVKTLIFD